MKKRMEAILDVALMTLAVVVAGTLAIAGFLLTVMVALAWPAALVTSVWLIMRAL